MARKHYRHEGIMKFLVIVGALVGIATIILRIAAAFGLPSIDLYPVYPGIQFGELAGLIVIGIVGIIICFIAILSVIKPDNPIPFHWLLIFILGVLILVFSGGIWACALLIIAAIIGIIDEL
ncbi:MAG: hypothetical protein ACQERB_05585 [Promethearchaeati archaeon]